MLAMGLYVQEMRHAARLSCRHVIHRGADLILARPFDKLDAALDSYCGSLSYADLPATAALARATHLARIMRDLGRRNHYSYSSNRLLALRQAQLAARYCRRFANGNWSLCRTVRHGSIMAIAAE